MRLSPFHSLASASSSSICRREGAQGALERADDEGVDIGGREVGRAEMTRIEGADQALDDVDDGLARGQRRRRAAIAALLRGRSEAAKLGGDRDEIEVAVRLRTMARAKRSRREALGVEQAFEQDRSSDSARPNRAG